MRTADLSRYIYDGSEEREELETAIEATIDASNWGGIEGHPILPLGFAIANQYHNHIKCNNQSEYE
jgi:hypothetical protein